MLVFAVAFLTKALVLPALGRTASRIGSVRLLWLAVTALVPASLLWLPTGRLEYLLCVQVVSGCCWAAYELSVSLLFFEAVADHERTGVVTVYNLGLAVATVAGAACGGMLLRGLGEDRTAYIAVFAVSSLLRLASFPLLRRVRFAAPEERPAA
jgi:MFS family permease